MNKKQVACGGITRRTLLKYGISCGMATGLFPYLWMSGCTKRQFPNIILITLDTTRADHLGCYGYHRNTSPNLDQLAAESVLYTKAIAPASWTLPSHASLFTGKFTTSHGVQYDPNGPLHLTDAITGPKSWELYRARGLARKEVTLAGILKEAGYKTGAVVAGPWMKKLFGLNEGFDFYDDREIGSVNGRLARQVTNHALKWINQTKKDRFFLFLNYFDPHGPYSPPDGFYCSFLSVTKAEKLLQGKAMNNEERISLYDGEILYMDHHIGKLLQRLKAEKLYEKSMIIITADHGELFGEHDKFGHGHYLFQEEIHVPLFIKYPGKDLQPRQTDAPVQLNDIFAMILEYLGISLPGGVQAGVPPQIGHPLLAEVYPLTILSQDGHWRAIFEGDYKFIWNSRGNHNLYNLKNDPHEEQNLAFGNLERKKNMMAQIDRYLAKLPAPGPSSAVRELDENTKNALKSLGYVE